MKPGARNRFVEGLQERRARHKERHHLIRVAAAIGGFLVVLLGIIMIPLPGPGLLVVAVGLAVLALEFAWAEHLLEKTVDRLSEAGGEGEAREPGRAGRIRTARGARRGGLTDRRVHMGRPAPACLRG